MTSEELTQLEKQHLWHPFTQMRDWEAGEPLFIESGQGVTLRDREGRAYWDANSSMWLNLHGHNRPEINAAIAAQLEKIAHSTLLGLTHEPGTLLAARLTQIAPPGLTRVFYSDDGSTANEVALKMAYQYWKHQGQERPKFVAFGEGYHGDTLGAVSVGGVGLFHGIFKRLLFSVAFAPPPGRARDLNEAAAELEAVLQAHPGEISAVILEPLVQIPGGILISPPGYLKRARELCDRYDTLLIADEVAVGLGRTGTLFACEQEGVTPDFLNLAKGLTGGYLPLAATLATERIYEAFLGEYSEWKAFTHGHSYTGNQLGCAAALASLEIFENDHVIAGLPPKIERIRRELEGFADLPHVQEIRHIGMVAGIELVKDKATGEPYALADAVGPRVCRRARALGLITRPLGSTITFLPPLVSSESDIEAMLAIIKQAIIEETAQDMPIQHEGRAARPTPAHSSSTAERFFPPPRIGGPGGATPPLLGAGGAFSLELENRRARGLYRKMRRQDSAPGTRALIDGRTLLNFGSNNYLGLTEHPAVRQAAQDAVAQWGTGASGSRLTTGDLPIHEELEEALAAWKGAEAALLFAGGYQAAIGAIPALAEKGDLILSDALNHASLIDGCRLSRAEVRIYRHGDVDHVRELLADRSRYRRCLVITDGVFSMDGDLAPLPELCALCEETESLLLVDDAHGAGVLGQSGSGTAEHLGVSGRVPIQMGTLSKALGAEGGFIAGSRELIDFLRNAARSFVFSTAPAPASAAAALAAVKIAQAEPERRRRLAAHAARLRAGLIAQGRPTPPDETPIIPVLLGDADAAMQAAAQLEAAGIWAPAIRPPTVPEGAARLRVSIMATHTPDDIERLLTALETIRR